MIRAEAVRWVVRLSAVYGCGQEVSGISIFRKTAPAVRGNPCRSPRVLAIDVSYTLGRRSVLDAALVRRKILDRGILLLLALALAACSKGGEVVQQSGATVVTGKVGVEPQPQPGAG